MTKLLLNKVNIIALTTILFVFIVSLVLNLTGAVFSGTKTGNGNLVFNNGIFFEMIDMDMGSETGAETNPGYAVSGKVYHMSGSNRSSDVITVEPKSEMIIVSPKIKVVENKNTAEFCVRAKISYNFYEQISGTENYELISAEDLGLTTDELINNVLETKLSLNSSFAYQQSTGYYYLLASGTSLTADNLKVLTKNTTEEIMILNSQQSTIKCKEWDLVNGGPYGIDKLQIVIEIDVVEKQSVNSWGF